VCDVSFIGHSLVACYSATAPSMEDANPLQLLTSSSEGVCRLWDVASGVCCAAMAVDARMGYSETFVATAATETAGGRIALAVDRSVLVLQPAVAMQ
jgi:hypothetical protein